MAFPRNTRRSTLQRTTSRSPKNRAVTCISDYKMGSTPAKINTAWSKKLSEDLAKKIYLEETSGYYYKAESSRREGASRRINDAEFIEKYILKDAYVVIPSRTLRRLKTTDYYELIKRVAEGDYSDDLKKIAKGKLKRLSNALTYILT